MITASGKPRQAYKGYEVVVGASHNNRKHCAPVSTFRALLRARARRDAKAYIYMLILYCARGGIRAHAKCARHGVALESRHVLAPTHCMLIVLRVCVAH